ncbi:putative ABC transport system permease protein [Chitinophaga jiangningensis]|uniref:Putative ABC transport system permease protein n=1 Tax=Chitinophaga jiangningensis TaxID=1419482 RepID=A0A1M7LU70_9BACT|nr:FtsX-like permease family protein [Chitinophaga jiangningensis]SHM81772.1 putative ABC transport system permease protein [Chitinophaga jiangningensis]
MFPHLIKLIWNRKGRHLLLVVEILVSFLVIFGLSSLLVTYYRSYAQPAAMNEANVWDVSFSGAKFPKDKDSMRMYVDVVKQELLQMPEIKSLSLSGNNTPFSANFNQSGFGYKGKTVTSINTYRGEDNIQQLLQLEVLEGRWFSKEDEVYKNKPVVIGERLKDEMFGSESPINKILGEEQTGFRIIGVVKEPKFQGDYLSSGFSCFMRVNNGDLEWLRNMLIRVDPAVANDATFEGKLYKKLGSLFPKANIEIHHLSDRHREKDRQAIIPVVIILIIATFMIINVALGMFGVLWYNINKRRSEIGLRRAVGATGADINRQLVGESMVIASFALLIGVFFAVQFPLMHVFNVPTVSYLVAIGLSVLFIYLLVLLCSFYPGKQAAAIFPAVALHED